MLDTLVTWFHAAVAAMRDLQGLAATAGVIGLSLIIFAETGLLIGFFLPGDSLLLAAGLVTSRPDVNLDVWVLGCALTVAAVLGDATGYFLGRRAGMYLFERKESFFFRRSHLEKAHAFYLKHGGKTIVLARFVPIVRTFAPTVAGAARMPYGRFAFYNVLGAFLWIWSFLLAGHYLGRVAGVEKYMHYVVIFFFVAPGVPVFYKIIKEHFAAKRSERALAQHAQEMKISQSEQALHDKAPVRTGPD